MRIEGGGPPYYKLGSSVRYLREDLDEWARSRRRLNTSDDGKASAAGGSDGQIGMDARGLRKRGTRQS